MPRYQADSRLDEEVKHRGENRFDFELSSGVRGALTKR
jgi:hypothetical protein